MDERFAVPDFDLDDDDPVVGDCVECFKHSRLLNVDMLCPKCVAQQSFAPEVCHRTADGRHLFQNDNNGRYCFACGIRR